MDSTLFAFSLGIGLSIITVLADVFIKKASLESSFSGWAWLVTGMLIYAATGFGWFFVMRKEKLSVLGVLYAVSIVLCLTLVSVFYFKEKMTITEGVGIAFAVTSLILLARFA